jgi:hypothetical protein
MLLPPDAWALIGLHLKPRYLAKLILTSKTIKQLVDTETYWCRVSAHLIWRDCDLMEVRTYTDDQDRLPRIHHNLYHMLGLDHGYFWGMERFLQRMEEVIDFHSNPSKSIIDEYGDNKEWCIRLKSMSLTERTHSWLKEGASSIGFGNLQMVSQLDMSMKEMAKLLGKDTLFLNRSGPNSNDARFNKFACEIEDHPMPPVFKRVIFDKLDNLLWSVYAADEKECCPLDIAHGVCKF